MSEPSASIACPHCGARIAVRTAPPLDVGATEPPLPEPLLEELMLTPCPACKRLVPEAEAELLRRLRAMNAASRRRLVVMAVLAVLSVLAAVAELLSDA